MENKEQEMIAWVEHQKMHPNVNTSYLYRLGVNELVERFLARFAPKPMTFMEAVEAMKQGKKVRRREWENSEFIAMGEGGECDCIVDERDDAPLLSPVDFTATDWEVCE